jgi:hypothetical protein
MYGKALRVVAFAVLAMLAAAPLVCHLSRTAEPAAMTLVSSDADLDPMAYVRIPAATAAATSVSSTAVVSAPGPGGCTVTVGGEEKHGQWDGRSWCCVPRAGGDATCYNCDYYTCKNRLNVGAPGVPPREVEPAVP